jgi:hypothetical protein
MVLGLTRVEALNAFVFVPLLAFFAVFWGILVANKGGNVECGPRDALEVRNSSVHGRGLFARRDLFRGDVVGPVVTRTWGVFPQITPIGAFLNHACDPVANAEAEMVWDLEAVWDGDALILFAERVLRVPRKIDLKLLRDVPKGSEVLQNYEQGPWFVAGAPTGNGPCQPADK